MRPVFLMSPPRRDWTLQGRANFRSREAVDVDPVRARVEWCTLADAIVDAGGEVLVCPPNPKRNLTGMIYTAEAGEFYRDTDDEPGFILPNMEPKHRRIESDWIGGFMEGLGIATRAIGSKWEAQGDTLRGAEPDQVVHTWGEGPEARTSQSAYREVAALLGERHVQIRFDADPWFHGNTFMNVYRAANHDREPPAALLVCPEAVAEDELEKLTDFLADAAVVEISREESLAYDTNSLQVENHILAPAQLSDTARRAFRRLGLKITTIELGELFGKGGGAPVCLTNRLWGLDPQELPDHAKWSSHPHIKQHTDV